MSKGHSPSKDRSGEGQPQSVDKRNIATPLKKAPFDAPSPHPQFQCIVVHDVGFVFCLSSVPIPRRMKRKCAVARVSVCRLFIAHHHFACHGARSMQPMTGRSHGCDSTAPVQRQGFGFHSSTRKVYCVFNMVGSLDRSGMV